MARVHNFSAGPAALPTSVLAEIADEMMDYRGCGMSVLEMSHRSSMYQQIIDDAEATLRRLLSIPDNYRVLFLQGGATLQFAGIPMNLMRRGRAGYVVTGNFANKAYKEAAKYGEAVLLASSEDTNFDRIPTVVDVNARIAAEAAGDGLDYVYICQNNTIFGTMYHELPNCGDVPLVADVSSCFLSQPLDVERYGLIYAGAQKNAVGKLKAVQVFGNDYPTPDGTGVRDYIHVCDLASGHVAALNWMNGKTGVEIFNLGTGTGTSVLEVVAAFSKACGKELPYVIRERRAGDIAANWCDASKAERMMGWKAQYDIADMCRDSWNWQSHNPNGFADAE